MPIVTRLAIGLALGAAMFAPAAANAQQPAISIAKDSSGKTRTFLAGQISAPIDISSINNKNFSFTPSAQMKKGAAIAAMVSNDQAWSMANAPLLIGTKKIQYPIIAIVKGSDGNSYLLTPGVLKFNVDIEAGRVVHLEGYQIKVERPVKGGDAISSVYVWDSSFLSAEAADGATESSKATPLLTVLADDAKPNYSAGVIEAWQIERNHIGQ
jgi:hypothetical protein